MKNVKRNSVIISILTILMLVYILKDNYREIFSTLINVNPLIFILIIILYVLYFLFDNLCMYKISKQYNNNITFKFMCNLGILTKFFNGITPLATGGQPMQIYYFSKNGVKASYGANIIVQNYIIFQIDLIIIGIYAFIYSLVNNMFIDSILLLNLTIIGFLINIIILLILLLLSINENIVKTISITILKFLNKIKIVKNYDDSLNKLLDVCTTYHDNSLKLFKNKRLFISCIIYEFISQFIYYSLPFVVALSLNSTFDLNFINGLVCGCLIYMIGCYVPIPGGSGGMEYAFTSFIGIFINNPSIFAVLLIWRFITYYLPTITGAIAFNMELNRK